MPAEAEALREAAEMLSACHEAERRHFGDPAIISLPDLGHIELLARRAAGKSAPPAAAQPFGQLVSGAHKPNITSE